jgi:hypothetical protein
VEITGSVLPHGFQDLIESFECVGYGSYFSLHNLTTYRHPRAKGTLFKMDGLVIAGTAIQTLPADSSHEFHGAAGSHNQNRAARVSKRMFGSRAGDLWIDLRRSVIWTKGERTQRSAC